MINCPKCGADNMVGAIFCRTCGEKLNLNELTPDVFDAPPVPVAVKIAKIVQRIVILVVILGLVAVIAGLFIPTKIRATGYLEQSALTTAQQKFRALQSPTARTPTQIPFSSDEATAITNETLGLPSSGSGNKKPLLLSIEFLGNGTCRFILKSPLFGQVPLYTTVIARPTVAAPGDVQFRVLTAHTGKLPLPGGLKDQAVRQFTALNIGSSFANAEKRVRDLTITSGSCTITIRR